MQFMKLTISFSKLLVFLSSNNLYFCRLLNFPALFEKLKMLVHSCVVSSKTSLALDMSCNNLYFNAFVFGVSGGLGRGSFIQMNESRNMYLYLNWITASNNNDICNLKFTEEGKPNELKGI